MARIPGIGNRFFVDDTELSATVASVDNAGYSVNLLDRSVLQSAQTERDAGLIDHELSVKVFIDDEHRQIYEGGAQKAVWQFGDYGLLLDGITETVNLSRSTDGDLTGTIAWKTKSDASGFYNARFVNAAFTVSGSFEEAYATSGTATVSSGNVSFTPSGSTYAIVLWR